VGSRAVTDWTWRLLHWRRPIDPSRVAACLRHWAADERSPRIALEVRASTGQVTYWLGTPAGAFRSVAPPLRELGVTQKTDATRDPVDRAGRLSSSTRHRALRLDDPEVVVRAILLALARARSDELLVLQVVLGPRRVPLAVPNLTSSSTVEPWWLALWRGDGGRLDGEKRAALRRKVADHGFACTVRLGVRAATADRQRALLLGLMAAVRTSEAPGVTLRLRRERAARLHRVARPWLWPLRLGVPELVSLIAWPLGEDDLPGQPALHPRRLPPPPGTTDDGRVVARSTAPGTDALLTLSAANALHHLHVLGPTGTGKSTLLANLITQDLRDERAVVVVEPKGDLVADILARVPDERRDDIVVLDPNDTAPVGLNPLAGQGRRPELVADAVLATFKQLYGAAVGPRSQDILYASLLTLAQRDDASLVMVPLLLTNPGFRRSITAHLREPMTLEPFWAGFEAWSENERAAAIAPVMNKLRPLLRPGLRGVLGQRAPRFDIRDVFTRRKVLLVPLRRGVIGPDAARLLGSLVLTELWQAVQERSAVPVSHRHPVMVYVDEVQDYLHLPVDLGDALAQARGYGVGFTLAHQFMSQLPREMRSAVLANARSRVCFQLPPEDAAAVVKGHDELEAADLTALGRYEIYASLYATGRVTPYAAGATLALDEPTSDPAALRQRSRERYGQPLDSVEAGFAELAGAAGTPLGATGRRRRQP
jgi:Type IV secretion-system coupling protein DNA-binding domain